MCRSWVGLKLWPERFQTWSLVREPDEGSGLLAVNKALQEESAFSVTLKDYTSGSPLVEFLSHENKVLFETLDGCTITKKAWS